MALAQADPARAADLGRRALTLSWAIGHRSRIARSLQILGGAAAAMEQADRAARLLGAAEVLTESVGPAGDHFGVGDWGAVTASARDQLGADTFALAWQAGRLAPLDRIVAEALIAAPATAETALSAAAGRSPDPTAVGTNRPTSNDGADGLGPAIDPLTCRERKVVALLARGLTDRQIAAELIISRATATRHVKNILSRLGFRNRAQVAAWAVHHGLTDRPG